MLLVYSVFPPSLIVVRFPFVACGHDSANWFRIASAPPLFWIEIDTTLPLADLLVTDNEAGVGGVGGHGLAGELCRPSGSGWICPARVELRA